MKGEQRGLHHRNHSKNCFLLTKRFLGVLRKDGRGNTPKDGPFACSTLKQRSRSAPTHRINQAIILAPHTSQNPTKSLLPRGCTMCSAINGFCNSLLSSEMNDEQNEHTPGSDQNAAKKRKGEKLSGKTGRWWWPGAREYAEVVTFLGKMAHFQHWCEPCVWTASLSHVEQAPRLYLDGPWVQAGCRSHGKGRYLQSTALIGKKPNGFAVACSEVCVPPPLPFFWVLSVFLKTH